jgi:ubiquinone/menaquinone biosynthesis C-methylase UbiE
LTFKLNPFIIANKNGILAIRGNLNYTFPLREGVVNLILADQVIEHIHNRDLFVREMYRVLKYGGFAIVSTENLSSWNNVLAITMGKQAFSQHVSKRFYLGNPFSPHYKEPLREEHAHEFIFTYQGLKDLFEAYGFKVSKVKGTGYFPLPNLIGKVMEKIDPTHSIYITIEAMKP